MGRTKLIKEGGFSLADKVNFNEEEMKKIDVIGFIHAGLYYIMLSDISSIKYAKVWLYFIA